DQPDHAKGVLVAALHGGLHVFGQTLLEAHHAPIGSKPGATTACPRVGRRIMANAKSRPRIAGRLRCSVHHAPARGRNGVSAGSVQALALGDVARHATQLALHRGSGLALALLGRLLVVLALAGFGQDTGLLAGALEATQRKLEGLVLADFGAGHGISGTQNTGSRPVSRV